MANFRNRLELDDIAAECRRCDKCDLGKRVFNDVQSNMPLDDSRECTYMMVGANPTMDDLEAGGIFKSDSFRSFEELLYRETGLVREDFYLTNVCKCCPYGTRSPVPREIKKCSDYLSREVMSIKPPMILALGKIPLKALTGLDDIEKCHGRKFFSAKYHTHVFSMYMPTKQRMGDDRPDGRPLIEEDIRKFAQELKPQS